MHRSTKSPSRGRRRSGRVASLGAFLLTVLAGSVYVTGTASATTSSMALRTVDLSPSLSDYSYELTSEDGYRDVDRSVPESGDIRIALPTGVEAMDDQPLAGELTVDPQSGFEDGDLPEDFEEKEPTFTTTTTPGFTAKVVDSHVEVHLPMDLLDGAANVSLVVDAFEAYDSGQYLEIDYYVPIAQGGEARAKPVLSLAPTLYTEVTIDSAGHAR